VNRVVAAVLVVLLAVTFVGQCRPRGEPSPRAFLDWEENPTQDPTDREPFSLQTRRGAVTLIPRAAYAITARVVGVERYRLDSSAFLSPYDVALAWGPVPDYADRLSFQQMGRFVHWQTKDMSLDVGEIVAHVANTHTIPANGTVRRAIASLDRGEVARLEGLLVDANGENGFTWRTSLVRTDDGAGACELMWVESVEVGGRLIR
jgi:hypothetical protein